MGLRSLRNAGALNATGDVLMTGSPRSFLRLQLVLADALQGHGHLPDAVEDLVRPDRVGAAAGQPLHAAGHVHEHAQDPEELSLVGLLDDETALHGAEE